MLDFLSLNLTDLSQYLVDANKRIYWGYLFSALALAIPVFLAQKSQKFQKKSVVNFFRFVFPKDIYTARSARHDYALLVFNKLIKAALFPVVAVTMVPIALAVSGALEAVFGYFEHFQLSTTAVIAIFTLLLFIIDDFTRFLLHYLLHKVPILWEFHKVHHSAEVMTPFTIYRSHPVESYLYACRMALTQGFVVGVCYYFLGPTLQMFDILGANAFVFVFNVMGSNLRHSHIWLSWGDKIEGWFISPAQHQIHHSTNPKHFDVNLGSALAIWDRMINNLVKASSVKSLSIGLGNSVDHSSLWQIYLDPLRRAGQRIVRKLGLKQTKTAP